MTPPCSSHKEDLLCYACYSRHCTVHLPFTMHWKVQRLIQPALPPSLPEFRSPSSSSISGKGHNSNDVFVAQGRLPLAAVNSITCFLQLETCFRFVFLYFLSLVHIYWSASTTTYTASCWGQVLRKPEGPETIGPLVYKQFSLSEQLRHNRATQQRDKWQDGPRLALPWGRPAFWQK